jgi:manganese/zinc/iron transport system substrate-binding protein
MKFCDYLLFFVLLVSLVGCGPGERATDDLSARQIRVVATTGMIADAVREVGGERVEVTAMMGPGVDPHLYRATAGDVSRMRRADIIFYNGLHLEGRLGELFEQMERRGIPILAIARAVDAQALIVSADFPGNYDPHIWFDVSLWQHTVSLVAEALSGMDPGHTDLYQANAERYTAELTELHEYVRDQARRVPEERRVLVTAHDAFGYFGRAYGFEVRGLQGISTAAEAGTADVQNLAAFIAERRIPAIFVETSVSPRHIEAVRAAVRARGFDVRIGGDLYSDAMGSPGSGADNYIGMVRHNIDTIVSSLLETGRE